MNAAVDDVAVWLPCAYCGATSGIWCRTKSGLRARWLHRSREWLVSKLWRDAYWEGWFDGLAGALEYPDYARGALERSGRTVPA